MLRGLEEQRALSKNFDRQVELSPAQAVTFVQLRHVRARTYRPGVKEQRILVSKIWRVTNVRAHKEVQAREKSKLQRAVHYVLPRFSLKLQNKE